MMNKNTTAIILGSNGCIGQNITQRILEKKNINIISIDKDKNSKIIDNNIKYLQTDFSDSNQIDNLIKTLPNPNENNILISTIGIFGDDYKNNDLNYNNFLKTIQINLLGISQFTIGWSKKCIKNNKKLRIVILGSTASNVGSRDIAYGVSKSGINGLVLGISKSFATESVTIIGVNPGIFKSPMSESVSIERQRKAIDNTHIKRLGSEDEIANIVEYCAINAPDFLTGSFININGGQYS